MNRRFWLWLVVTVITAAGATVAYQSWRGDLSLPTLSVGQLFSLQSAETDDEDKTILVYSAMLESQVIEYITAFRTQHPDIQVNYQVLGTVDLVERILLENDNPQADVIWGLSATSLQALAWQDALTPYSPEGVESLPEAFRDHGVPPMWVGQDAWMSAFCVNNDMLEEAGVPVPLSWHELLDPMYEGMIAFPSPGGSGTGYMTLLAYVELIGESELWEALDQLDRNVATYDLGPESACTAAAEGEYAIAVSYGLAGATERKTQASLTVVFPEEGSGWDMEASALVRKLPAKQAAKTLMDYIISEDAMHHYGLHYAVTAVPVEYIAVPLGFPEHPADQLMPKDFLWAGANRNRLLAEWNARYQIDEDSLE